MEGEILLLSADEESGLSSQRVGCLLRVTALAEQGRALVAATPGSSLPTRIHPGKQSHPLQRTQVESVKSLHAALQGSERRKCYLPCLVQLSLPSGLSLPWP